MTSVPLRAYIRTIDNLIEFHKLNEAILHGNHILKLYPKNIDTYRLLGKALLECENHEAAEVIFNRILNVHPDDFIANLGLSYIYETRGDLSESVRHMELAFELQPANESIQDELRRLYKQRDGIEPTRVRLTRGALLKMYARSNLHQQAIAEIRIALHEHPERIDFEIVLAKMLVLAGSMIEAVETCLKIVAKIPYCFEANEILFQILPENLEKYNVEIFHKRLIEINPYYKYVSKQRPDIYAIPEVAVSLEELQEPSLETIESINWFEMMEEIWADKTPEMTKKDDTEIPWDEILSNQDKEPSLTDQHTKENKTQSSEPIPDWLKPEESNNGDLEYTNNLESLHSEIIEESGLVDEDAPILESPDNEKDLPSSIWTQETEGEKMQEKKSDEKQEDKVEESSKSEKVMEDQKIEQYYGVVLKDAHDALLSGFPDRAVEGYRQLLQENRMSEKVAEQLKNDLLNYPNNFQLWIILGDSYQRLGMASEALEAYQNAQKYLGS